MPIVAAKCQHALALIVTSNIAVRRILRSYLSKDSEFTFEIQEESRVVSAVDSYLKKRHDLVLLGETVDGGEPVTFLRGIYKSPEEWHPVVFVHFSKDHSVCLDAMRQGAREYVELGALSSSELSLVSSRIHETLKLIRENRKMVDELARSNSELGQYAYAISHDLKEPLRKITSFGVLLQEKMKENPDEEARHFLERMIDAAGRMGSMMSALLEYARVSHAPAGEMWSGSENAIQVVRDALEIRLAETQGSVQVLGALPEVECEPMRLQQLFLNLIGNGLKYAQDGVAPIVKIRFEPSETSGCFVIEDNGIGFTKAQAAHIFGIFQRLHAKSSKYEGQGVGLAICKRIVESLEGRIWAEGEPGVGAKFFVELPRAKWKIQQESSMNVLPSDER